MWNMLLMNKNRTHDMKLQVKLDSEKAIMEDRLRSRLN